MEENANYLLDNDALIYFFISFSNDMIRACDMQKYTHNYPVAITLIWSEQNDIKHMVI